MRSSKSKPAGKPSRQTSPKSSRDGTRDLSKPVEASIKPPSKKLRLDEASQTRASESLRGIIDLLSNMYHGCFLFYNINMQAAKVFCLLPQDSKCELKEILPGRQYCLLVALMTVLLRWSDGTQG